MRFKTLLNQRCTLMLEGQKVGEDEYGRDILQTIEHMNVPCRIDQPEQRAATDEVGTDYVTTYLLFLDADQEIDMNMIVRDIRDKRGNLVLQGSFSVLSINPIFHSKLHHYEIKLQRV